jgi:hypothetical protein
MTDEKLQQLLQTADANAGPPPATTRDLATAIHHRLTHRRRRATQLAAASTILLCTTLALLPLLKTKPPTPPPITTTIDPSKLQAELSLMRLTAQSQAATIDQLLEHQRLSSLRARSEQLQRRAPPDTSLQHHRDAAARLLLHDADRTRAPDQYRRLIDLFPETPWASLARQRLENRT